MPHKSRELLKEYALEIVCRAQTIQEKCNQLLAEDFASQSPGMLAITISRMCSFLEGAVKAALEMSTRRSDPADTTKDRIIVTQVQILDSIIVQLGADIGFIEASRTPSVPWSVIKPFERFAVKLIPGITVMLIPQWEYNYGIVTSDLYKDYRRCLEEVGDLASPSVSVSSVLEKLPQPFHLVFFPALERKNILLHCLLGHELGHLLSEKYVAENEGSFLATNRNEIAKQVEQEAGDREPLFMENVIRRGLQRASIIWKRGLEETLSDVVGAMLFGPAMLLSALEMSVQANADRTPSEKNRYYPPWRFRIREIFRVMESYFPPTSWEVPPAVRKRIDLISEIISCDDDEKAISENGIMKIAYREIRKHVERAKKQFFEQWGDLVVKPLQLGRVGELVDRLDHGIPPNAYEQSADIREPADIVDIINAAWFHKISWEGEICSSEGQFDQTICDKRDTMNVLTLKAIEYSDLEMKYRAKVNWPKTEGIGYE